MKATLLSHVIMLQLGFHQHVNASLVFADIGGTTGD
jgi:hypothetical protein